MMPSPNPMMGGMMGGARPPGGEPAGPMPPGGEGGGNPEQIKGQLVLLLRKAKEVADEKGIDWNQVLSEVEGNKVKSEVPLPRPPSPAGL